MTNSRFDYTSIDLKLKEIDTMLFNRIQELAKFILTANDNIDNFCMAMGSVSFGMAYTDESLDERHDDFEPFELMTYDLKSMDYIKELDDILENYNYMFSFTGNPVNIDKVNGELFTVYHW